MIQIENLEVFGWEAAVRGMRNPMNSWNKSDSYWGLWEDPSSINPCDTPFFFIGPNDLALMKKLIGAGTDHSKFMRYITVTADIIAPLYWWKEYDTYKISTVANSCSTMHKIHAKPFTPDDFSHDHLLDDYRHAENLVCFDREYYYSARSILCDVIIPTLNFFRDKYLETNDKRFWWQLIQLLPSSYNQRRTVQLNYAVLRNMYHSRKNHKLDEWHTFCDFIRKLPYSELITGEESSTPCTT